MPIPTPASYWPWIRPLVHGRVSQEGEDLMKFTKNGFVLVEGYVRVALGVRQKDWFKGHGPLRKLTNPMISRLPQVIRFNDYRQYLAHVLGGYAYELQDRLSQTATFFNGTNTCKVSVGPSEYSNNILRSMWESILNFMSKPHRVHMWLFNTILAQDNFSNDENKTAITLQELVIINEKCAAQGLNGQQKGGIMSYFHHRLTIIVGPPGTGKSILVDTIAEIEASLSSPCDVPKVESFQPQSLIVNNMNASELKEVVAFAAILRALNGGKLKRILLIGDRQRLPPTAKNPQNTFAANSELSLMERLILAGTPYVELKEQFHARPSIPATIDTTIEEHKDLEPPSAERAPTNATGWHTNDLEESNGINHGQSKDSDETVSRAEFEALKKYHGKLRQDYEQLREDHEALKTAVGSKLGLEL